MLLLITTLLNDGVFPRVLILHSQLQFGLQFEAAPFPFGHFIQACLEKRCPRFLYLFELCTDLLCHSADLCPCFWLNFNVHVLIRGIVLFLLEYNVQKRSQLGRQLVGSELHFFQLLKDAYADHSLATCIVLIISGDGQERGVWGQALGYLALRGVAQQGSVQVVCLTLIGWWESAAGCFIGSDVE